MYSSLYYNYTPSYSETTYKDILSYDASDITISKLDEYFVALATLSGKGYVDSLYLEYLDITSLVDTSLEGSTKLPRVKTLVEESVKAHFQALWSLDDYPIEIKHKDLYYDITKFDSDEENAAYKETLFTFENTFFKQLGCKIRESLESRSTNFTSSLFSLLYSIIEAGHGLLHFTRTNTSSFKIDNIPLLNYQYLEDEDGNIIRILIKEQITEGHSRGVKYKLYCKNLENQGWNSSKSWDKYSPIENHNWTLHEYCSYVEDSSIETRMIVYEPRTITYTPVYLYKAPKKQTAYLDNKCVAPSKVLGLLPTFKYLHNVISATSTYAEKQLAPDVIRSGVASFENRTSVSRVNRILSPRRGYQDWYNDISDSVNYNKGVITVTPPEGTPIQQTQEFMVNPGNPSIAMELIQLLLSDISSTLDPNSSAEGRTAGARMTNDEFNARSGMDYVQYIYEVAEISGSVLTPLMHTLVDFFMEFYKKTAKPKDSYFKKAKDANVDLKNIIILFNQQQTNALKGAKYNELQSVLGLSQASLGLELQTQGMFKSQAVFDEIKALSGFDLKKSEKEIQEQQEQQQMMQQAQQQTTGGAEDALGEMG